LISFLNQEYKGPYEMNTGIEGKFIFELPKNVDRKSLEKILLEQYGISTTAEFRKSKIVLIRDLD
jgi:hypothetical protein